MTYWRAFFMKHTTMTAVSGRVGLAVLTAMLFASGAYAQNVNSSALNVGGQNNGKQSVSGVGNDQNVTGNNSTGIYNNAAANGNTSTNKSNSSGNKSNQALTINSNTPSSQTIYNVPNVYAPGLAAAGAEVCLGSVSAGGAGAGIGVSIGGTYVDTECQLRLNARTLATLGYVVAAREEMCLDTQVRAAMLAAGSPCAADLGGHAAPYNAQASYSPPPVQEASAQGCERRYQLFGGWYEVCK
jgi:alkylhydroperoxidase/carboxymuconolactone decarboxylase family protein YurZ